MKQEKITIKNQWNELTISEFIRIQELAVSDFSSNDEYLMELLCILSDKDRDFLQKIPATTFAGLAGALQFLNTKIEPGKLQKDYIINGKKYNAMLSVSEFSAIQYIDMASMLKENKLNDKLHYILSIILIPEGKEYNTYNIHEVAEEIKDHFRMVDAHALSLFFSTLTSSLIKATQMLSARKLLRMEKKEKDPERKKRIRKMRKDLKSLARNGAGITTLTK